MTDTYKPSWVPEEENDKFACRVMYGVTGGHEGTPGVTVCLLYTSDAADD